MDTWRCVFEPFLLALLLGLTLGPILGACLSFTFDLVESILPRRADPAIPGTAILVFLIALVLGVRRGMSGRAVEERGAE